MSERTVKTGKPKFEEKSNSRSLPRIKVTLMMVSTSAYLYNFENHEIFVNDISKYSNIVPFAYELLHIDLKLILRKCKYQHGTFFISTQNVYPQFHFYLSIAIISSHNSIHLNAQHIIIPHHAIFKRKLRIACNEYSSIIKRSRDCSMKRGLVNETRNYPSLSNIQFISTDISFTA